MSRRPDLPLQNARFCANRSKHEVHDLDNETVQCHIDAILTAENAVPYDTLSQAHEAGYENCQYCLRDKRK